MLGQAAHLLAPTDPPHSLIDILYSRVSHDPDWGAQAQALAASRKLPALINKWPLPDLPDPALRRTLTGHTGAGDGGGDRPGRHLAGQRRRRDGTVRIWDPATGQQRATLTGHAGVGDGGGDRPGRHLAGQRRPATGRCGSGTRPPASSAPPSPATPAPVTRGGDRPGRHLAGQRRRRRVGADLGPGHRAAARHPHRPHRPGDGGGDRPGRHLAGQRPATTGRCGSGTRPPASSAPPSPATASAVNARWRSPRTAPGWPAAAADGTVRIWDPATGQQRATLTGHGPARVTAVAIAPDGTWLASRRRRTGSVRIWDPATGQQRATLTGHTERGDGGGDRPGRHLAGQRRSGRDGADLGPGHRPA